MNSCAPGSEDTSPECSENDDFRGTSEEVKVAMPAPAANDAVGGPNNTGNNENFLDSLGSPV